MEASEESFELSAGSDGEATEGTMANCSNGIVEGAEACDGVELQGITCENLGRDGGVLACSECTFDVSECGAPVGMVLVPGGVFTMGSSEPDTYDHEQPARQVYVSAFWIDRTEVTVKAYAECVDAGVCSGLFADPDCNYVTVGREDHPVNCMDWSSAQTYCDWVHRGTRRLPTEAEWEKAVRGTDGRKYPWGDSPEPSCERVVMESDGDGCGEGSTWPVGSKPAGASPYGALDMAGNVWEWTSDYFAEYDPDDTEDPVGPADGSTRVMRGGGWFYTLFAVPDYYTTTYRLVKATWLKDPNYGVRCVMEG